MNLYERIGGAPAVSVAVDRFYLRDLADPMLEPFFEKPQEYSGAAMLRPHARLGVEQRHFDAVAGHLVETLRELGVGEEIVGEVVAAVTPLPSQIVNKVGAASA